MIRVWGRTNSSNVMKVLWLLDELALAHERVDAGLAFGRLDTPEYLAMNPLGQVPVLEDGPREGRGDESRVALFESNTILRYLCAVHAPDNPVHPAPPVPRARVEAWMDAQLATFQPPFGIVFQQLVRAPAAERDDAALSAALDRCGRVMALLEDQMATRDWLAGGHFTLADIAFGPLLHRWFALPLVRAEAPGLRRWYERLLQRPAYVARCAQPLS